MKRVRAVAAVMPAALGLVVPVAAQAASAGHGERLRPRTAFECENYGSGCFSVTGPQNWLSHMKDYHWYTRGTAFVGYRDVPGYPAKSKWRATAFTSRVFSGWYHNWYPNCSFPTGTLVYGYTNYDHSVAQLSIHGSTFTGHHKCA